MLKISNLGPNAFKSYIKQKKVYIYGAGRSLESCIDIYFENKKICKIVDNNPELWGKRIKHGQDDIEIIGLNRLKEEVFKSEKISDNLIMISSPFYAAEIIEELDKIPELDGIECFLQILIRNTREEIKPFEFSKGISKIPKKIHYIWIGGKELPDDYKRNIESWKKFNPDYEIIRWDESNYDFKKIPYMKEAYESKAWGFVPNYARLNIIYQYGGIYLDTDVEVLKSLNPLLNDNAFFSLGCADRINQGCGFGAMAGHSIVLDMMKEFEKTKFLLENGQPGKKPCHTFIHPVIKKYGFEICNKYQKRNGVVVYPNEVMSPLTIFDTEDFISEKTISLHKESGTWKNEREKDGINKLKKLIREGRINNVNGELEEGANYDSIGVKI